MFQIIDAQVLFSHLKWMLHLQFWYELHNMSFLQDIFVFFLLEYLYSYMLLHLAVVAGDTRYHSEWRSNTDCESSYFHDLSDQTFNFKIHNSI